MEMDRRQFGEHLLVITMANVLMACQVKSPVAPDPPPASPPAQQPQPSVPQSDYGTFYKEGFAGVEGTIEHVLTMARLNPTVNNTGLLTHLDGRPAPMPANAEHPGAINTSNGFYFLHVNGHYFGGGSAREYTLKKGDNWQLFDWNGKWPPGN